MRYYTAMALLDHTEAYSTPYIVLAASKKAPGYSDAVKRDLYEHHAIHCATKEVTAQISLVYSPREDSDEDWFDYGTGKYVPVDTPAMWVRAKGVSDLDVVHVLSVHPNE